MFVKKSEYIIDDRKKTKNLNIQFPEVSKFLIENGLKIEYPENKKFSVVLTHDVDEIYPPLSHNLISSMYYIKDLDFNKIKNQIFWKYKGKESSPYWNFKEIMKLEEKYDAKSSFYFLTADHDVKRFRYDIEDLENELKTIVEYGWEVGLHGGYFSFNNLENISKEKKKLENILDKEIIGYRNHYLRFEIPVTWKLLADAGFKYDTTFGYNKTIGFRNGMCHPFKPFDLLSDRYIDILEIPLTIMDTALIESPKSLYYSWIAIKNLIDIVEKYNGVLTILWHNHVFNFPIMKNWSRLYERILKYCKDKNAWMTSGEDIFTLWNDIY